jgi:hypothetical protein
MMMMKDAKTHFTAQNSHGHAKEFLRKLSKNWARALKKVRQPCPSDISKPLSRPVGVADVGCGNTRSKVIRN